MKWIKKIMLCLLAVIPFSPVFAEEAVTPEEAYEAARNDYLSAWMSMAAYDDPISRLGRKILENENWKIEKACVNDGNGHARFLLARPEDKNAGPRLILSVEGTTDYTDVKADFSFDKTLWREEDTTNREVPKVHRGFKRYADSIWDMKLDTMTVGQIISKEADEGEILLTGHSMGGAVSVLLSARAADEGLGKNIKVETFGAPAVGNEEFAAVYGRELPIRRIVHKGDPVDGVVQKVIRNYAQTGKEEKWIPDSNLPYSSHQMIMYLDSAIRRYYDAEDIYEKEGGIIRREKEESPHLYIRPLIVHDRGEFIRDIPYMEKITKDYYEGQVQGAIMGKEGEPFEEAKKAAEKLGCRYVVSNELSIKRDKLKGKNIYMTLTREVRSVSGTVVSYAEYRMTARNMTPLEASLYLTDKAETGSIIEQKG